MFNKKGVSLITVLLFMLIATIAGTATYKWLSSAQGSSASRMNIAEAQQASNAGLDAVRAWMTYHANDVGAVIRQYIDGGKKPVRLDAVVKAFGSHKQDYSVWLTGADVAAAPYRLKITSVGTARGGAATYSENSILRVNGLYRVKIPEKSMGLHFNDAFAGEHDGITSNDSLQSGLITGDFETNNIPVIYSKMVITGKAKYGGNITHESDVYIAGNLEAHGTITFGTPETIEDFVGYVGGNVECASGQPFTVYGDLYLGGSVTGCKLDVKGNLTVAGNLEVADGSDVLKISVDKNMVFTETGVLDYNKNPGDEYNPPSFNSFSTITVGKNLYLPDKIESHCETEGQCGDANNKRTITVSGDIYRYDATHYYVILNKDASSKGIYMQGTLQGGVSNDNRIATVIAPATSFKAQKITKWDKTDNVLKNVPNQYWTKIEKMKSYGRLIVENAIPQPLLLDHVDDWMDMTANEFCGGILNVADGKFDMDDDAVDALNNCYGKASASDLYNGFLVIKWNYNQQKQPSHTLKHKFVLYATEKLGGDPYLPATSDNGMVFLYLQHGGGELKASGEHNYVIYSAGDVDQN